MIDQLYRLPKGKIKEIIRMGGPFVVRKMNIEKKRMEKFSESLRIVPPSHLSPQSLKVNFLTGSRFWFQTIFCMYSLQKHCPEAIQFVVFDDGSFTDALVEQMKIQVPGIKIHRSSDIELKLKTLLPESEFPYLNHKRKVYPHIKKLIDIHAGNSGWNLVADSDMLFLRNPEFLLTWFKNPVSPFYISDKINAYGFPLEKMDKVSGKKTPEKVNVGLVALKSETINWHDVERWARELEEGTLGSYYLEQALTAMILAGQNSVIGPESDYIVMPTSMQVQSGTGVLHHFVDSSKPDYFIHSWKKFF